MSHFYGVLLGAKGKATRAGSKNSGMEATAASWDGAIKTVLYYNSATGKNHFEVWQTQWEGKGILTLIAKGTIGI